MREILFRGKRLDNGKFVEGDLWSFQKGPVRINPHVYGQPWLGFPVNPETISQYTGLKDKNGVKIFEGDIVDCWSAGTNAKGTVIQRIDGLWIIYPAWQMDIMWGLFPDRHGNTAVEVIGNKYDNPELVKELE